MSKKASIIVLALFLLLTLVTGCENDYYYYEEEYDPTPTSEIESPAPIETDTPIVTAEQNEPITYISDFWQVFFTSPGTENNQIVDYLIDLINDAETSIHIASFEFNLTDVAEALIDAKTRGLDVRFVTDDEHGLEADEEEGHGQFAMLEDNGIEVIGDDRSGLMHNKFWIFDNEIVWTGSTNITVNGTQRNNNNVIVITSEEVAAIYEAEFQEMWAGDFGVRSPSPLESQLVTIDEIPVLILFAAEDEVAEALSHLIENAEESIRFMAFSFTHDDMGAAVLNQAINGIDVAGIFELRGSETVYSELTSLFCADVPVRQDGNTGTFHHKVLVIDESIVATGSFNFSKNADDSNDENILIIYSPVIAQLYLEEFDRRWEEGKIPVEGEDITCN
jgi:phosphatidylserine/phosphatidylglycerophosphate/cardiolipin synthase-like enzyme